jgi:ribose/xylose/arabinose/galactoside ABC-type transport system permease subunit
MTNSTQPVPKPAQSRRWRTTGVALSRQIALRGGPFLALLVLIVYLSIASPFFFSPSNFYNVARQSAVTLILAVGQTIVIIAAGIDLSIGSILALSGCAAALWVTAVHVNVWLAIVGALALGALLGATNGVVIAIARLPDFIVTLGTLSAFAGLALISTGGLPVTGLPNEIVWFGTGSLFGIPVAVLVAAICALGGWFLLDYTRLGRAIFAMGGNLEAAKVSGINVARQRIAIYAIAGLLAAVASLVMMGRIQSANAQMGEGLNLDSIAAVVIGGTNLFGGEGTVGGTVIGALIMGVIANGMDLLNISAFWQPVMLGTLIVVVVLLDQLRRRRFLS